MMAAAASTNDGGWAMADAAEKLLTIDAFLNWDDGTARRYELVGGRVVAMMTPLPAHGAIALNIGAEIRARLRPPCRAFVEAGIERPDRDDKFYYADVAVTCAPARPAERSVPAPVVIVEVLSPGNAAHDRGVKLPDYMAIPSVREIVLADSTARHVQLYRREAERWIVETFSGDAVVPLMSVDIALPLGEIYRDVALG